MEIKHTFYEGNKCDRTLTCKLSMEEILISIRKGRPFGAKYCPFPFILCKYFPNWINNRMIRWLFDWSTAWKYNILTYKMESKYPVVIWGHTDQFWKPNKIDCCQFMTYKKFLNGAQNYSLNRKNEIPFLVRCFVLLYTVINVLYL